MPSGLRERKTVPKQTAPCPPTPRRSSRSWRESAVPVYAIHDVPDPCGTRGSFCGSSSITNSNWHSWDISKMNPWRAASSCFYFALVLRMSKPLNEASGPRYSAGQTNTNRVFLSCEDKAESQDLQRDARRPAFVVVRAAAYFLRWRKLVSAVSDGWAHADGDANLGGIPPPACAHVSAQTPKRQAWLSGGRVALFGLRAASGSNQPGAVGMSVSGRRSGRRCAAPRVTENSRGWILNFASCRQELPSKHL